MRIAFLVAAIAALVAAGAWALASSKPADKPYTVEVSDVAGVRGFTVTPEVVVQANRMPEVVVRAGTLAEVATRSGPGSEVLN